MSPIVLLLAGALIFRFALAGFGTLALDQNTFIAWANRVSTLGFSQFYNAWSDYLPGYIYILWLLARLEPLLGISTQVFYKLPAILADIGVGYIVYYVLRKKKRVAFFAAALFLFNPAVLANSTFWGQVDILTSLTALLSVVLINIWPLSAALIAFGMAIKPQAAMALPVILALAISQKWEAKKYLAYGLVITLVIALLFLPYTKIENLPQFIYERVAATVGQYPYGSINAFNFWGLWGFWKPDAGSLFGPKNIGVLLLLAVSLFTILKAKLTSKKPFHFLAILFIANFMFFTRMHERHLLPALAPLAIAAATAPLGLVSYVLLSLTYVANMYYSYQWITQDFAEVFSPVVIKGLIITNLVALALLVKETLYPTAVKAFAISGKIFKSFKFEDLKFKDLLTERWEKWLIIVILTFSIFIRLFRLEVPANDYFDEIYHAFTARQMLLGDPKPWHWTSEAPEGFAYEWTHPPLAKEIMAISMGIFGVNSFAWRLPGALLGVVTIFAVYLIAKKLFGSRDIAVLSAFVLSLDGLLLTMSRIGTADVYFVAFAFVSYYLFLQKRDFSSAVFLGLAAAAKWSTLWVLPVFGLTFLLYRKKLSPSLLWFFIIPPLIYLASYLPMFTFGYTLETFWGMQKQMWWYHSGLVATHPYTSPWWSWPLLARPVYLYQNYLGGPVQNIYALGNPFFFWFGGLSLIVSSILFLRKKAASLLILVVGYLVLFAPWALSPRIMFLYHYLPALPFMAISLALVLKKYTWLVVPVMGIIIISFVYFFPHWTALTVSEAWDKTYYWFPSWR